MDYRGQVIDRFGKSMTCPPDLGKEGTPERAAAEEKANAFYSNGHIIS
jgi:hypothetical protein